MSNFFSAIHSKVKPVEEEVMRIFPLTTDAGVNLCLTAQSPRRQILLTVTLKKDASIFQFTFEEHDDARTELEAYAGPLSKNSKTQIHIDKYETYYTEFTASSHVDFHDHPVDVVIFLVNGSISMRLEDGNTTVFKKGDFFFIPKGLRHHFSFGSEGAQCIELWKGKDFW